MFKHSITLETYGCHIAFVVMIRTPITYAFQWTQIVHTLGIHDRVEW